MVIGTQPGPNLKPPSVSWTTGCIWIISHLPSLPEGSLHAQSLQLCPTLSDPLDCSPPGSSVPGILQARILEWVAMPSSRGSSQHRDQLHVSCISCTAGGFFTAEPPRKPIGKFIPTFQMKKLRSRETQVQNEWQQFQPQNNLVPKPDFCSYVNEEMT